MSHNDPKSRNTRPCRNCGACEARDAAAWFGLEPERVQPIEGVVQACAVDSEWRALIEAVARQCHTSAFKTLRSALPPGWLGAGGSERRGLEKPRWQVVLGPEAPAADARLGERQRALLELLRKDTKGYMATAIAETLLWYCDLTETVNS